MYGHLAKSLLFVQGLLLSHKLGENQAKSALPPKGQSHHYCNDHHEHISGCTMMFEGVVVLLGPEDEQYERKNQSCDVCKASCISFTLIMWLS